MVRILQVDEKAGFDCVQVGPAKQWERECSISAPKRGGVGVELLYRRWILGTKRNISLSISGSMQDTA
jgi:hypothetical protein